MIHRKPKKLIIGFVILVCLVVLIFLLVSSAVTRRHLQYYNLEVINDEERLHQWSQTKNILYWAPRFGSPDLDFGTGGKMFQNCHYKNCYTTYHRSALPVEQFDAILFHGPEYRAFLYDYPRERTPHQIYVYLNHEYPENSFTVYNNFYNWTWSYRRDADIYDPYGRIEKSLTNYTLPSIENIQNKTKMIAWMVSHCNTPGKREELSEKLNQYVHIDVYGSCGSLECSKDDYDACYKMIANDYKFYLSFENSDCKDYVTEKFFNILGYNVIPIVYGGADYKRIAPEMSYIDVKNFTTVRDLANYLNYLSANPKEYLKYFQWKKNYKIVRDKQKVLCDFCRKLNEHRSTKVISDLEEWWRGKNSSICSNKFIDTIT